MLTPLVCVLILAATMATILRGATRHERRIIVAGLAAHLLGSVAIVVYHERVYHGGDMLTYATFGREIVHVVERDHRYFADVVKLTFHLDNDLALDFFDGSSSGTMCALMAFLIMVLGDNLYAVCMTVSLFALVGQVSIYRAVAPRLHESEQRPLLFALMLVPSVVFWTSGLIKEAFVVGFLGVVCRGLAALPRHKLLPVVAIVFGVVGTALVKPYVLFALVLGIAGWVYASRSLKLGAGGTILALILAVGGVIIMARLFPEYGAGLAANVSRQQSNYDLIQGSDTDVGDVGAQDDPSLLHQVRFLPLAILNSLTRPLLFEAHNASSLLAALEMTVLLLLAASLMRHGTRRMIREVVGRPPLMFAAVFVFTFSVGIGLTTRNLGTLSRYRVPALPFYVGLVVVLRASLARSARLERAGRAPPARRPVRTGGRRAA